MTHTLTPPAHHGHLKQPALLAMAVMIQAQADDAIAGAGPDIDIATRSVAACPRN